MKSAVPITLGLLNMFGCSVGKPTMNEVRQIENATLHSACVGSLDRWHRVFSYQRRGNRINADIISVLYVQAGHRELPAGSFIQEPDRRNIIDDAQFRVAGGEYNRANRRFSEWSCGCNFPPFTVDRPIECPSKGS